MWSASVIKVDVVDIDLCVSSHLKEELAWAVGIRAGSSSSGLGSETFQGLPVWPQV